MAENVLGWREAIEQVIADNGGVASLKDLYNGVQRYRNVSTNKEWQATLRGILYLRVLPLGRVKRVGLGVFGFEQVGAPETVFQKIVAQKPVTVSTRHSDTQGMLLELGNFYKYDTYTADPSRRFDGKALGSLASLSELPPFTGFPDLMEQVKKIDVVWCRKKTTRSFPLFAFEVENTPEFGRSLLKMFQLRDFNTNLCVIAAEEKRDVFLSRLKNDPFHELEDRYHFRTFANVTDLYAASVRRQLLEDAFFEGLRQ